MYNLIISELKRRQEPINVCIVGCGWVGRGVVRQLLSSKHFSIKAIITKTIEKAICAYHENGIKDEAISVTEDYSKINKYIVSTNIELIKEMKGIDVVYECTGNVLAGATAALSSFAAGLPFVTMSSELDATIGLRLACLANEKGVIYTNSDGDQPGVLARMLNEISFQGFTPIIAGCCKEFLDIYQTPEGVKKFIPSNVDSIKACSYTDGSKQSLELTVLGNAFGLHALKRGLHGPKALKSEIIDNFDKIVGLDHLENGYVDYTLGSTEKKQGGPVFIIAFNKDKIINENMKWLKKGDGPYYLFFRDHHLGFVEAPASIAEAVLLKSATISPKGKYLDTIALAKRKLEKGKRLDVIGGYDYYGLVENSAIAVSENLLPLGLAEFSTLIRDVNKDQPITYRDVDLDKNLVTRLRQEQDALSSEKDII
ncbi:MAG TPA: hypothetical protein PKN04_11400 [bacterium]|nr:hypothetical protein [bacterium]HNT66377.1 hypothetical protein [bacterium]